MALGNQYGINLDNVLSTASTLKTAELRQKTMKNALDQDDADVEQGANFMEKAGHVAKEVDLDGDGEISADEKKSARNALGRRHKSFAKEDDRQDVKKSRAHSRSMASDRNKRANTEHTWKGDDRKEKKEKEERQKKSTIDLIKSVKGVSHEQAEKEFDSGVDTYKEIYITYEKANDAQKSVLKSKISTSGAQEDARIQQYTQLGDKENPGVVTPQQTQFLKQETERMQAERKAMMVEENSLRKEGRVAEADEIGRILNKTPEKWTVEDAQLNLTYASTMMSRLDDYDTSSKNKNALTRAQKATQTRSNRTNKGKRDKEVRTVAENEFKKPTGVFADDEEGLHSEFTKKQQRRITIRAQEIAEGDPGISEVGAFDQAVEEARGGTKDPAKKAPKKQPSKQGAQLGTTGQKDGEYTMKGKKVIVKDGKVYSAN